MRAAIREMLLNKREIYKKETWMKKQDNDHRDRHENKIGRKSTLLTVQEGMKVSIRKIITGSSEKKELLNKGIVAGSDLEVLDKTDEGVIVRDTYGRKMCIPDTLAAYIYVKEPLERHLDPVISGGCCSYGNTAGALDMMDRINDEMFGEDS